LNSPHVGQIRGVLAERCGHLNELDPFMPLTALAAYAGLSVRRLRDLLEDGAHPLPHYRCGGKILVRRSEFDHWMGAFRQRGPRGCRRHRARRPRPSRPRAKTLDTRP
jgi:excisionase family DNA binding protein